MRFQLHILFLNSPFHFYLTNLVPLSIKLEFFGREYFSCLLAVFFLLAVPFPCVISVSFFIFFISGLNFLTLCAIVVWLSPLSVGLLWGVLKPRNCAKINGMFQLNGNSRGCTQAKKAGK